jgi:hypothetical protein
MAFKDKTIRCSICGGNFIFTAGEQVFHEARGLASEPKRCHVCRSLKKPERSSSNGNSDRYSGLSISSH